MLSLYKLEIFYLVVQEGSFSRAAERLLMSQSGISQHMQVLEASLGTTLFNRGRRGVTLTPAGELLFDYTRNILRLVAEAENAIADVENLKSGQVRIGSTPAVSLYVLPEWIQAFRERYPNFTVTMQSDITTRVIEGVLDHKLEIGFVEGEIGENVSDRLGQVILQDFQLFVMVGTKHPWWDRPALAISELNNQPFITRQPHSQTRIWMDKLLMTYGVQVNIVAEFDNPESIKRAACTNMGIAILPEYAVQNELNAGRLRALPLSDVDLRRTLKLIWHRNTLFNPITRTFLTNLAERFPQLLQIETFQQGK